MGALGHLGILSNFADLPAVEPSLKPPAAPSFLR
jgi:hypothetical protein